MSAEIVTYIGMGIGIGFVAASAIAAFFSKNVTAERNTLELQDTSLDDLKQSYKLAIAAYAEAASNFENQKLSPTNRYQRFDKTFDELPYQNGQAVSGIGDATKCVITGNIVDVSAKIPRIQVAVTGKPEDGVLADMRSLTERTSRNRAAQSLS